MQDEVSSKDLREAIGKRVEVLAFGINYVGVLTNVDSRAGTIRVEDKEDYAVLEIERIESFKVIGR
jgi:hypothetical protein